MKRILYISLISLVSVSLNAQLKIDKHIDFSGKNRVVLDIQISDSIKVMTWNKNEVYLAASVNINDNKDNEAYQTSFSEEGSSVTAKAWFKENYFNNRKNNCVESEIDWVVYIPERAELSVESINADITITGRTGPLNIKTISGFIDLTVPDSKAMSVDFSTISGTVYTNHLLSSLSSHNGTPSRIRQDLNAGGEKIRLETISGDIFFRK